MTTNPRVAELERALRAILALDGERRGRLLLAAPELGENGGSWNAGGKLPDGGYGNRLEGAQGGSGTLPAARRAVTGSN
jgi:hypothetical protein